MRIFIMGSRFSWWISHGRVTVPEATLAGIHRRRTRLSRDRPFPLAFRRSMLPPSRWHARRKAPPSPSVLYRRRRLRPLRCGSRFADANWGKARHTSMMGGCARSAPFRGAPVLLATLPHIVRRLPHHVGVIGIWGHHVRLFHACGGAEPYVWRLPCGIRTMPRLRWLVVVNEGDDTHGCDEAPSRTMGAMGRCMGEVYGIPSLRSFHHRIPQIKDLLVCEIRRQDSRRRDRTGC